MSPFHHYQRYRKEASFADSRIEMWPLQPLHLPPTPLLRLDVCCGQIAGTPVRHTVSSIMNRIFLNPLPTHVKLGVLLPRKESVQ
jgi:hypothetical protein